MVQSPSPGIRLHSLVTLSVLQLVSTLIHHYITLTPSHPLLGVLSIGIRAYAPDIRFNHLGMRSWLANLILHLHTYILYPHGFHDPSYV